MELELQAKVFERSWNLFFSSFNFGKCPCQALVRANPEVVAALRVLVAQHDDYLLKFDHFSAITSVSQS